MTILLALVLLALPASLLADDAANDYSETRPGGPAIAAANAAGDAARKANLVRVHKDAKGYQILVDGKPTMIFGMNWDYVPIGENYNYDFWGQSDDFIREALEAEMPLLQEMHVNVIRQYIGMPPRWIEYVYEKYGIYTMLNHPIGRWGLTIDGAWVNPVDYSDERVREVIKDEIRTLVEQYKDTPGLIMWLLGNENNYGLVWKSSEIENLPKEQREDARAEYLYSLVGEVTEIIHAGDTHHPVALVNGDVGFLDVIARKAGNLDVFGSNVYRGSSSRDIFDRVEKAMGIPFMYTEFGTDAYDALREREDHVTQARVLQALWQEIYEQSYGKGQVQNAVGGLIFQWADGWWKYKQEENLDVHDTTASWSNAAYPHDWAEGQNNMNEEWFGICAKGQPDPRGLYELYPRSAYYLLKDAFALDPYAPDTDLAAVRAHFGRLGPRTYAGKYEGDVARAKVKELERLRVSQLRLELETYTTGGRQLNVEDRDETRFDHLESFYVGVEARPTSRTRAEVVVNALGNVAENPINEIFYENRGQPQDVRGADGEVLELDGLDHFAVYQASADWESTYFNMNAFYRVGHYHWGYEGDFFGLYPEANYQPAVDMFDAQTPNGMVFEGKKQLEGVKIAFGPELYWGANPTVIAKYYNTLGDVDFSVMHQEDIEQQGGSETSSIIPQPVSRKTTVFGSYDWGKLRFQLGGIMAGTERIGWDYETANDVSGPGYLGSGYEVIQDDVSFEDTLGMRAKVVLNRAPFYGYVQAGYRGLVADAGADQTMTITGWSMKESGQGNHWAVSSGAAYYLGDFVIGPNVLVQRPLEGPLSRDSGEAITGDFFDPATGIYYPGVSLRNQLDDPFWVRSNRETYGFELLLAFDPTPATFMFAWDNLDREDATLSAALDFVYRILPTSQDAGVAVSEEGYTFAFSGAAPSKNLADVSLRTISNPLEDLRWANWIFVGQGQANGDDGRTIERWGAYGKAIWRTIGFEYHAKVDDWGPYDYHRDFNLTFPVQLMGDLSYSFTAPKWFATAYTRYGVRSQYRTLDKNSNRYLEDPLNPGREGYEWEVMTYVHLSL